MAAGVPHSRMSDRRANILAWLRRRARAEEEIAAVEFALILPLMLMLYLGSVELTKGVLASRKITLVARALSDLASQQLDCPSNAATAPCLTDTDMTAIFSAATAILSPYSVANLKMTVSQVDIVTYNSTLYAYTKWSVTSGGGVVRPCAGGGRQQAALSSNSSLIEANVGMATSGYEKNFPTSYTAATASSGSIIVADVAYDYYPGFGFQMSQWGSSSTKLSMNQIQYMRTRSDGKPITSYMTTNATNCATNP